MSEPLRKPATAELLLSVPHVIRGECESGTSTRYRSRDLGGEFATAPLQLDKLIWSRMQPGPAFDLPSAAIVDFLVATGERLVLDRNAHLQEAAEMTTRVSPLGKRIIENTYRDIPKLFERRGLMTEVALLGTEVLDGWPLREGVLRHRVRAFPPRILHVPAGNSPLVSGLTIVRGALTKGVHLIKLPSNDLFTATAILRTMAEVDPRHPVVQSFSAAYWRGGDERVESNLYRAQYFDKIVAWGGEASMRHIQKYIGPGLELIAFDPKTSLSLIGREAFESPGRLREVAALAALDVNAFNQDACVCARFQFVEGTVEQVDQFCDLLLEALGGDSRYGDAVVPPPPKEIREEIEGLRMLEPLYRIFGRPDGRGIVIRSSEPVSFHPSGKTVNVIPVQRIEEGVTRANVATQTVGVYPSSRKRMVRDALASAGVQRVVPLGRAVEAGLGQPNDAFYPLQRFVRWVSDEGDDD